MKHKIIALLVVGVLLSGCGDTVAEHHSIEAVETGACAPTIKVKWIPTPDHIEEEKYYDSLEYLAMAVEAEAGNQGLIGKVAVACVILNRVESSKFPNDIVAVIQDKNQFEVYANGRINCVPSEESIKAVIEAIDKRPYKNVYFFTAGRYNPSGTPMFILGDHYFSGL